MANSDNIGLLRVAYDGKGKSCPTAALYGKARQSFIVAGVQPTAKEWKNQFAYSSQDAASGFKPGHYYAIDRVRIVGSAIDGFVQFRHSDFDGCKPGGYVSSGVKGDRSFTGGHLVVYGSESLEFSEHGKDGQHPVFSANSALSMDWLCATTGYPVEFIVEVVDLGMTAIGGVVGSEDVNGCYASTDNAQTMAVATVVSGDSLQIAQDRGNAVLRDFALAGPTVVAGKVSAPVDVLQPNAVVVGRSHPGVHPYELRDIPVPVSTVMTLYLASYSAPA